MAYFGGLHPDPALSSHSVHQHVAVRVPQGSKVGVVRVCVTCDVKGIACGGMCVGVARRVWSSDV